jgi:hypothetical protein
MNSLQFKKGIFSLLMRQGFAARGDLIVLSSDSVSIVLGVSHGFGAQWFIDVGFTLLPLSRQVPVRVEQSHMYFRLERLFPEHREAILKAGRLDDPEQENFYHCFVGLLDRQIVSQLGSYTTLQNLANAFNSGGFTGGLVTKGARQFLAGVLFDSPS